MSDRRIYVPFDDECNFCVNRAEWSVYANADRDDVMQVCDAHKTSAFS